MARYAYTATLPTITGSHSDFPVLLTNGSFPAAAIDGGATSILNGGGNLRAYTDNTKTTQLPVEIVTFVTGGTPDIQVWVKVPIAFTSATIYIEADTVAIAQPAVTDTYGRNAVWSSFEYVDHMENSFATDATGNQGAFDDTGEPVGNSAGKIGQHADLSATEFFRQNIPANTTTSGYYLGGWIELDSLTNKQVLLSIGQSKTYIDTGFASTGLRFVVNNSGASLIDLGYIPSGLNHIVGIYDGTTIELIINGVVQGSKTVTVTPNTPIKYLINNSGVDQRTAAYDEVKFGQIDTFTADYVATEYANENDPDNWLTVGAWEDQDAGAGFTLDIDGGTYSYSGAFIAITADRLISVDGGAYSYDGAEINLTVDRVLNVIGGVYSYSGGSILLLSNHALSVDGGAYTHAGSAIALVYNQIGGFTLDIDGGAYSYSGSEVSTTHNRLLAVDGGTCSFVGSQVALLHGRSLSVSGGNYSYTGGDIDALYNRAIQTDGGIYSYTGANVGLSYSASVTLLIGGYSVQFKQDDYSAEYQADTARIDYGSLQ